MSPSRLFLLQSANQPDHLLQELMQSCREEDYLVVMDTAWPDMLPLLSTIILPCAISGLTTTASDAKKSSISLLCPSDSHQTIELQVIDHDQLVQLMVSVQQVVTLRG